MDHEEILESLLDQWQQLREQGITVRAEELCVDHPELLPVLVTRIAILHQMEQLAAPGVSVPGSDTTREIRGSSRTVVAPTLPASSPPGYEILCELGRGGMGVVYKARQISLNRIVALKMILAGGHSGALDCERFRKEAEAIARLSHPNVVQIHEIGEHEGRPFLSLEYVEGGSLQDLLRQQPLTPRQSAALIRTLALAIQAAHDVGLVHRDLKPANILLDRESLIDLPRITDFGLAKRLDVQHDQTSTGHLMGTPAYMAPELLEGQAVTPRADVYSLGVLLYECLTGQVPFRASTLFEMLDLVQHTDPVAPTSLNLRLPRDISTICLRCLEKAPSRRYASARELADDLGRFLNGDSIHARPQSMAERTIRWANRHRSWAAAGTIAAVALVGLIGAGFWASARVGAARAEREAIAARADTAEIQARAERERARDAERLLQVQQFFTHMTRARETIAQAQPGWTWKALDDLRAAGRLPEAASHQLELRSLVTDCFCCVDARLANTISDTPRLHCLAWHPSGKTLALGERAGGFLARCQVHLVDVSQPSRRTHLSVGQQAAFTREGKRGPDIVRTLAFSPQGHHLAAGMRSGYLHLWDLRTTPPTLRSCAVDPVDCAQVAFSPDGKAVYTLHTTTIRRWEVSTLKETTRWTTTDPPRQFLPHPQQKWLAVCLSGSVVRLDARTLKEVKPPLNTEASYLAFAPDGDTLVLGRRYALWTWTVRGNRLLQTVRAPNRETAHPVVMSSMSLSPDGTLLLSSSESDHQVRLWDLVTNRLVSRFSIPGGEVKTAFAPDGRSFAIIGGQSTFVYELNASAEQGFMVRRSGAIASFDLGASNDLALVSEGPEDGWGEVCYWKTPTLRGAPTYTVPYHDLGPEDEPPLALRGPWLAVQALHQDHLYLHDLAARKPATSGPVESLGKTMQFGPDDRLWVTGEDEVQRWKVPPLTIETRWKNSLGIVLRGVATIRDVAVGKNWTVAAGKDGLVRVFSTNAQTLSVHSTSNPLGEPLKCIVLSPDQQLALVGGAHGRRWLLRIPSTTVVSEFPSEPEGMQSLAWGSNSLVACGYRGGTIVVYQRKGETLVELFRLSHQRLLRRIQFSSDGTRLVVLLDGERGIRVWHLGRLRERFDSLQLGQGMEAILASQPAGPGKGNGG
ncbi:MAG: WD40 repeat domain-containing serine/threonine-protein kinase [Gemmataceae bacterium]